ncbi:hypothetical protein ABZS86_27095 [Streptomyces sp. NPDC005355]|uniref:hypothetical protein n=1 Tax=Streptomyces sp. NPDC005355 TaxID=3157038 RepID=UPI0033A395E7
MQTETHTRTPVPWTPPRGADIEMVEVGPYWDAVRAPATVGERALELLGRRAGAVIADYSLMYWLVHPQDADYWPRLEGVQVLTPDSGETTYVGVPPVSHTSGPRLHWRLPVGPRHYFTNGELLYEALARAIMAEEEAVR